MSTVTAPRLDTAHPRGGSALHDASPLPATALRTADVVCAIATSLGAYAWRHGTIAMPAAYQVATIIGVLLVLIVFPRAGVYRSWRGQTVLHHAHALAVAWMVAAGGLLVIGFTTKTSATFSRAWMIAWIGGGYAATLIVRVILSRLAQFLRSKGWNHRRVLIVGQSRLGREIARRLDASPGLGLEVVAVIDARASADLASLLRDARIDEVWLATSLGAEQLIGGVLDALRGRTVSLRLIPDVFGSRLLNHEVRVVAGLPVVDLLLSPMVGINRVMKAVEDRVLALLILLVVSPLVVVLAVGVKLTSPGPVIFRQRRHGWDGKPFTLYKFRTMAEHEEPGGHVTPARRADARLTRFGAALRRTSLDELPQLINVLQGHMSLVGPRPHAIAHGEHYQQLIEAYRQRYRVKPGITGWAQVNGWRGETDVLDKMIKRVEYDLYYIEHWSVWFDLKIMVLTLLRGFYHTNAY